MRLLALLSLIGCAPKVPHVPGPLAAVGRRPHTPRTPSAASPDEPEPQDEQEPRRVASRSFEREVVDTARRYLERLPDGARDDCSGFTKAVFGHVGVELSGGVRDQYALAEENDLLHHHLEPQPGDLVFFDDTYDANHDGRTNDPLTHVAIVLEVDDDGNVLMAHGGTGQGRTTLRMNLHHPDERGDDDVVWNDWLRREKSSDPYGTRYFSGELWRAFATIEPDAVSVLE